MPFCWLYVFEEFCIFGSFLQWDFLDFGRQKSSFSVILEAGRAVWYESLQKKDVGKTGLQSIFVCQRDVHCCKKSLVHIATPANVKMAVTNTFTVGMFLSNTCVVWWGGCAPPHP